MMRVLVCDPRTHELLMQNKVVPAIIKQVRIGWCGLGGAACLTFIRVWGTGQCRPRWRQPSSCCNLGRPAITPQQLIAPLMKAHILRVGYQASHLQAASSIPAAAPICG